MLTALRRRRAQAFARGQALTEFALVGACYGLVHRELGAVSLVAPVRMDYDNALGPERSAAPQPSRCFESI